MLSLSSVMMMTFMTTNASNAATAPSLEDLAAQNQKLQAQVARQQKLIEELDARLSELQQSGLRTEAKLKSLEDEKISTAIPERGRELRISGEVGLAFFSTGSSGQFPNSEFRLDDAKLFLEAPVLRDTYFFTELQLFPRESGSGTLQLGELYVDFENVSGHLGWQDRALNIRAGRMNIPFGTEYLVRGPMDNPLISHSLADIWGLDSGVEIYGEAGRFNYVFAVQNGGDYMSRDYDSDKSVTARASWSALPWLQLGASAMRTGDLKVETPTSPGDELSAVWFGNGFFRQLGSLATTTSFHANLWQGDATASWSGGHVSAALGGVDFDDNDTADDNSRHMIYGSLEGVQNVTDDLFGAVRYSRIDAPGGYPLVGWGDFGRYFFGAPLTTELSRLSVGLGYRIGPPMVLKFEYSFEWGKQTDGSKRDSENFLGTELGMKF